MKVGVKGFLTFEPVDSGNTYYNSNTGLEEHYKHAAYYFIDFIEEKEKIEIKDFKFI